MTCTKCGAAAKPGSGRFCSHCGAAMPDAVRVNAYEYSTHRERFAAVASHAEYPEAMAWTPRASAILEILAPALMMVFGVGFAVVWLSSGGPAGMNLVFGVFILFFLGALGYMMIRGIRFALAPVERVIAVVVDERVEVSGGSKKSSPTTHYHATLELDGGDRHEVSTKGDIAGAITRGDIGVAYLKGGRLIDYRRIAV